MTSGACLCGAVRIAVDGPLRPVVACHCQQCRKATGHHVAATSALRDHVTVVGQVAWYQSSDTARRGFCPVCGSNLLWDGPGANLSIMAGCLESPTQLQMVGHIFCADKGDYYQIGDDLPQSAGRDPNMTTMVVD